VKYAIDTEFIDTPTCSALISLAIVAEDGRDLYFEFDHPQTEITPWLRENVVPYLGQPHVTFEAAAKLIEPFVGPGEPEFWCHYGAYDWYWFCRLWGGFMLLPKHWPHLFRELAYLQQGVPNIAGVEHHALNDARSIMWALRRRTGAG
jgi:hypothetical protein